MIFVMITMASESAKRIAEVLTEQSALTDPADPVYEVADGSIEFDHVSFRYSAKASRMALSDIHLKIASGETIGIIGGTGSAKSTLIQLISRLYDATEGSGAGRRRATCASTSMESSAEQRGDGAAEERPLFRHDQGEPALGQSRTPPTRSWSRPAGWRRRMNSSAASRTNTTPTSSRAAPTCPAGRSSGFASHGRC